MFSYNWSVNQFAIQKLWNTRSRGKASCRQEPSETLKPEHDSDVGVCCTFSPLNLSIDSKGVIGNLTDCCHHKLIGTDTGTYM